MAEGYLTTHVLDTAMGCPAAGLLISLYQIDGTKKHLIRQMTTNDDGRTDTPILPKGECVAGMYELVFAAGAYLRGKGQSADILFLDEVPVRFGLSDPEQHYHVPLLLSPFGYSTYRGS
jgi:5-hydroxyisourate hydrolase